MSTIKANTLLHSDGSTTTQPSIPALDKRMAKAWVNFNGSGTVAIRSSYNVSSITDNGVGLYVVNFSTSMADADYSVSGMTRRTEAAGSATGIIAGDFTPTASSCSLRATRSYDGGSDDSVAVMIQVFGN